MRWNKTLVDLTGQTFGNLTVIRRVQLKRSTSRHINWLCKCECGKEAVVQGRFLRDGRVTSCGCVTREKKERDKMYAKDMERTSASLDRLECGTGDPYRNLANAIVAVAADDYRLALKSGNKAIQRKLEEFFDSPWCNLLTGLDCGTLYQTLQKEQEGKPKAIYA